MLRRPAIDWRNTLRGRADDGGSNVNVVCRKKTTELINRDGTEVRIKLGDKAVHCAIFSRASCLQPWTRPCPRVAEHAHVIGTTAVWLW